MYFYLEPERAIINDINGKLMAFYNGVRDNYDALRLELDEIERLYTEYRGQFDLLKSMNPETRVEDRNEALYYELRDMFNGLREARYSDALLYYYINKTAYSGMIRYNSRGEFNVPFGRYKAINTNLITKSHSQLLSRAQIMNGDYTEVFALAEEGDFMFLDPPYDCIFSDYGNDEYREGFNDQCHIGLAEAFRQLPCRALLVIGKTPLTERLYGDMIVHEYGKSYSVNIRNRFKSTATHILVANYHPDNQMLF